MHHSRFSIPQEAASCRLVTTFRIMTRAFDLFGRVISTLFGLIAIGLGVVWTLQAFNIAFNTPMVPGGPVSFMVNNRQWAVYGAIAALVGIGQVVWSNTRRTISAK